MTKVPLCRTRSTKKMDKAEPHNRDIFDKMRAGEPIRLDDPQYHQPMKHAWISFVLMTIFIAGTSFCSKDVNPITEETTIQNTNADMQNKLKIVVGAKTFSATLGDNATATALKKMLPMTLEMIELNGNEKYVRLPSNLPANASNPGTIHTGDLMLYGSNTLVLFYESFSTAYTYTKIGRIDDASGLAAALGAGNVKVSFELE